MYKLFWVKFIIEFVCLFELMVRDCIIIVFILFEIKMIDLFVGKFNGVFLFYIEIILFYYLNVKDFV